MTRHIPTPEPVMAEGRALELQQAVTDLDEHTQASEAALVKHTKEAGHTPEHKSDCATNNAPALPVGPCDCKKWVAKGLSVDDEDGNSIAVCVPDLKEGGVAYERAKLIAQAPSLLAECEALREKVKFLGDKAGDCALEVGRLRGELEALEGVHANLVHSNLQVGILKERAEKAEAERDDLAKLLKSLKWKSIEKDNMEFRCETTCYVVDQINAAIAKCGGQQ